MKVHNIYILCLLFVVMAGTLSAQQDPNYTFYRYNMNLINPAFAGASENTNLGLNVRSQWAGVEGAPETQSLVFGTPFGKGIGIGISIINDKTFVENQTSFSLDFSYKLKLNEGIDLYFGLKAGLASYNVNTDGLLTYGIQQDMSLINVDGRYNPNIGVGLYLKNEKYFISLSVPKILTPDRLEQNDGLARLGVDKAHFYLSGGYDFSFSETVIFKPIVLLRYVEASPISLDLTAILEFNKRIDIGAAYRFDESVSGIFIFKTEWMDIGYAYEIAMKNPIRNSDNGTHEIMMHLKF